MKIENLSVVENEGIVTAKFTSGDMKIKVQFNMSSLYTVTKLSCTDIIKNDLLWVTTHKFLTSNLEREAA